MSQPNPTTPIDYSGPKLTRKEAATYIGASGKTLSDWATDRRVGPPFLKIGKRCIYLKSDLDAWLASRRVEMNQ